MFLEVWSLFFFFNVTATTEIYTYLTHSFPTRRSSDLTALAEFAGSVLLVSHDRHLLRTTVDSFWVVADGQVQEFDGDLEDYRDWLTTRDRKSTRLNSSH